MIIIPAIDIKNGQCVRLKQGRMDDVTVFSEDPVAVAQHWFDLGCQRLHLVDLDGAVAGKPANEDIIRAISASAGDVPVQVGGGIRDFPVIDAYLDAGISQVIIGTRAVEDPVFFAEACARHPGAIILGLDARDGMLATDGWEATSNVSAVDFAIQAAEHQPFAIVYTDIARDGMLTGPNIEATVALAQASGVPVIASGGVKDMDNVRALVSADAASGGALLGAITGRAIYEGTLDLVEAQQFLVN